MKELMMIRRMKKNEKKSVKKNKRNFDNHEIDRNLNIKNDKIMNKYKEIMNKIKIKDKREKRASRATSKYKATV